MDDATIEWLCHITPWKSTMMTRAVHFWNPITRKITFIPFDRISHSIMYFPTNTPGTGERYISLILAVNGKLEINYDEDENRFDKNFNYLSNAHKTRVDIYLNRMADKKSDRDDR